MPTPKAGTLNELMGAWISLCASCEESGPEGEVYVDGIADAIGNTHRGRCLEIRNDVMACGYYRRLTDRQFAVELA
jgi:hypothetical protein